MSLKGENVLIQDRIHGKNQKKFFVYNRQYYSVYT